MSRPIISEEKLEKLLICLLQEFEAKHAAQTNKLESHQFLLTNRNRCAKTAGLNFEQPAKTPDNQLVTMYSSSYVDAVKELEYRGLVKFSTISPLAFTLTDAGYKRAKPQPQNQKITKWAAFRTTLNDHSGLIAVIAIIVGALVAWAFSPSV
ncbi:MAG: hypothetical protein NDI93_05425 [Pseudomonas sp.]|nr:hypothetical protein [Pseudomonas sp.]